MTHSYTVCEQSYDQREEHSRFMPMDDSAKWVGCGGSTSRTRISRHDPLEEELDPILSAAVRYKKETHNGLGRIKGILCCIIILLAISLLGVAFTMIFGSEASIGNGTLYHVRESSGSVTHYQPPTFGWQQIGKSVNKTKTATLDTERKWVFRKPIDKKIETIQTDRKAILLTTTTPTTPTKTTKKIVSTFLHDFRDCAYQKKLGGQTGTYQMVLPGIGNFYARCLMDSDHAWAVWQNRSSGNLSFWNNTFEQYAEGFGDLSNDEGWLGLKWIHALSKIAGKLVMRIRLDGDLCERKTKRSCSDFGENGSWWGDWEFTLGSKEEGFPISNLHFLRGNLSFNDEEKDLFSKLCNNQKFTTIDKDQDTNSQQNCAVYRQRGAWWHSDCAHTVLNGLYGVKSPTTIGMSWNRQAPSQKDASIAHEAYIIKPKKSLILVRISGQ